MESRWLPTLKPDSGAVLRLFCFPFAGGGAQFYYPWLDALGNAIDVCPVMLPGREKLIRSQPYSDMNALLPDLVAQLRNAMDIPYAFFGHSMGALIAYNVARQLREYGMPQPLHLFISAMYAPRHLPTSPILHNLPEDEFISALKTFNGTPQSVLGSKELMQVMLPYLRADFQLIETYRYPEDSHSRNTPALSLPFSIYGGTEDTITRRHLLLWKEETCSSCQLKMFPGGHFYLSEPHNLLRHMNIELQRLIVQVKNKQSFNYHNFKPQFDLNNAL